MTVIVGRPVVVVGDIGLDVHIRAGGPIAWGSDTPSSVSMLSGGAGGNTAAWLAAYGADVAILGRVGRDAAGAAARSELEADGVRAVLAVDEQQPTCVVACVIETDGQRTMFPDRGANRAFGVADVQLDEAAAGWLVAGTPAHLHLSGYVLFDEASRPGGLAALAGAISRGWTTSVDPQAASLLTAVGADTFLEWVSGVDLLLPNADELVALGGAETLLARGHEVVTTYGAQGARWQAAGRDGARPVELSMPAPAVHCLDSTGSGDAFDAGLLARWVVDGDRPAALASGIRAGSTAAGQVGARPPRRAFE